MSSNVSRALKHGIALSCPIVNFQTSFQKYAHAWKIWQRKKVQTFLLYPSGTATFWIVKFKVNSNKSFSIFNFFFYHGLPISKKNVIPFKIILRASHKTLSAGARVGLKLQVTVWLGPGSVQNTYRSIRVLGTTLAHHSRTSRWVRVRNLSRRVGSCLKIPARSGLYIKGLAANVQWKK